MCLKRDTHRTDVEKAVHGERKILKSTLLSVSSFNFFLQVAGRCSFPEGFLPFPVTWFVSFLFGGMIISHKMLTSDVQLAVCNMISPIRRRGWLLCCYEINIQRYNDMW